jgi:hypothetical protein
LVWPLARRGIWIWVGSMSKPKAGEQAYIPVLIIKETGNHAVLVKSRSGLEAMFMCEDVLPASRVKITEENDGEK